MRALFREEHSADPAAASNEHRNCITDVIVQDWTLEDLVRTSLRLLKLGIGTAPVEIGISCEKVSLTLNGQKGWSE